MELGKLSIPGICTFIFRTSNVVDFLHQQQIGKKEKFTQLPRMTQPLVHVHEIVFSTTDGKEEILQSDSENLSWTSSALLTYDKSWITKIWHEDIAPCQTVLALKNCNSELF